MRKVFRECGLSLVLTGLFLILLVGESVAGYFTYNSEQDDHGQPRIGYLQFLRTGTFLEATTENWESEFLEMMMFILLAKKLYQKGSSESKDPDGGPADEDADPREHQRDPDAPWPVRRGGWVLVLYEHSLSIAFGLLFLVSITLHAVGGARAFNHEQFLHGRPAISLGQFMVSSQFWFQSLQNWQSEFLGILSMVVLTVFLRERGSPQSKPVHASYAETTG